MPPILTAVTASSISVPHQGQAARPGLRTFHSRRFRMLICGLLLVVGATILGSAMARQAADPAGQFAIDFADYHAAAQRVAAGDTPYAPDMLLGPVTAQGQDRYRYPPPLAQLLVPAAGLPLGAAASVWLLLQALSVMAAVWVAGSAGGATRSGERLLWSAVAATWFLPVFDTLWKGNVSGFVALAVALVAVGGSVAGLASVAGVALKLVPLTLTPAAFLPAPRRTWVIGAAAAAAIGIASFLASPRAWADYLIVLPNLLAGTADYATNLAPAGVAAQLGLPDALVTAVRIAALVTAAAAVVGSIALCRRPGGRGAALVLGTAAMLLLPAALWYHYLAVLLPLGALAWPQAGRRIRAALLAGGVAISAALVWLPLALAGAGVMIVAALAATWPWTAGDRPASPGSAGPRTACPRTACR